jgi:WD40 repeat protein
MIAGASEGRNCAKCGTFLSADTPRGICPRCELEGALALLPTGADSGDCKGEEFDQAFPVQGRRFGNFELLEEIARGGMGIVYRARQVNLDRIVAVKMILGGLIADKQFVQRFRAEAGAAAVLQHPNIVAVHDVGVEHGQHYFSMDLVEGQNLAQLVGQRPLAPTIAARYVKLIAQAIQYAHEQGILHRDLKPSNVLIDANDQPRITDFGLAKRLDSESSLSMTGQVLGSPNFIPPEQASATRGKVGRANDVYGLGGILYFLLTARAPFQGDSVEIVVTQVLTTEPISPRLLNPAVPRDLETICLKCLEKEPARRYPTAQAVADELGRILNDEPIRARPVGRTEKVWRWCRRKPGIASLAAGLMLAVAVGFVGVLWQLRRVQQEQAIVRRNLYTADMKLAHQAWEEGNLLRAQSFLRAHNPETGREDLRGFEWRYLWGLCQDESRFTFANMNFERDIDAANGPGLALAADARGIVVARGNTIVWLDSDRRQEVRVMAAGSKPIRAMASSLSQPGLLSYLNDRLHAISADGVQLLGGGKPAPDSSAIALSPDGTFLASVGRFKTTITLFDVKNGEQIAEEAPFNGQVLNVAFSPDGKYLACATGDDLQVFIFEVPSLKQIKTLQGHTAFVFGLAFDPRGHRLATTGNDSHIIVWSFPDGREIARLSGHRGPVRDLAFAPDGRLLASAGTDHTVRLWDPDSPGTHTILHGHRDAVRSAIFSRDGTLLYTGSSDGELKAWRPPSEQSADVLRHRDWLHGLAFSPDGRLLAVADFGGQIAALWDVAKRTKIEPSLGQHSSAVLDVAFSHDGRFAATAGGNGVNVWRLPAKTKAHTLPTSAFEARLSFHPTDPILAVAVASLDFWDASSGQKLKLLATPPTTGVHCAEFSADGGSIAVGMDDGSVLIGDLNTGRIHPALFKHTGPVRSVVFSHDSTILASGGKEGNVILYDVRRRRFIKSVAAHTLEVLGLAFAPDDKTLVSTSYDGTIKLWSVANGQLALTLIHDGGPVTGVDFSADGKLMATSGADGTVRLWRAPSFANIEAAESRQP